MSGLNPNSDTEYVEDAHIKGTSLGSTCLNMGSHIR